MMRLAEEQAMAVEIVFDDEEE
ncbi:hypothetical protein Tco_1443432, partial [Tanacetum coccineum]